MITAFTSTLQVAVAVCFSLLELFLLHVRHCFCVSLVYTTDNNNIIFHLCLYLIPAVAVTLVLPCGRLEYASIPIIVFGCLIIVVACVCCVSTFRMKEGMAICCCICVALLLVPMLITGFVESSLLYGDYNVLRNGTNGTHIGDCEFDKAKAAPFALTILSYVFLVVTCCFSVGTCINAATRHDPLLYRCGRVSCCNWLLCRINCISSWCSKYTEIVMYNFIIFVMQINIVQIGMICSMDA